MAGDKGKALDVVLHAHEAAKDVYSSSIPSGGQITWHRFVLSPFYEPSPIYMLLNCWGLYAVGQLTLCAVVGGRKVDALQSSNSVRFDTCLLPQFLCLCGAAFALGRLLQFFITQSTAVQLTHVTQRKTQADSEVRDRLIELFFLPNGTWGFGPILNALIWFSCFAFPYLLYPATPSGITAPIWTAIGIPTLLLLEDLYSIIHASRRAQVTISQTQTDLVVIPCIYVAENQDRKHARTAVGCTAGWYWWSLPIQITADRLREAEML